MKYTMFFILILTSLHTIQAQVFKLSTDFSFSNIPEFNLSDSDPIEINLILTKMPSKVISNITIDNLEFFDTIFVSVNDDPSLENIKRVIKIDVEYIACSVFITSFYFLETEAGSYIKLPKIENGYYKGSTKEICYQFPSHANGVNGSIVKLETVYSQNGKIDYFNILDRLPWANTLKDVADFIAQK